MKKFRPLNAGYIFTYAVVILCILQGIWTVIAMILRQNGQDSITAMLDWWGLILAPFAIIFGYHYFQTVVEISPTQIRIVRPGTGHPQAGREARLFHLPPRRERQCAHPPQV